MLSYATSTLYISRLINKKDGVLNKMFTEMLKNEVTISRSHI